MQFRTTRAPHLPVANRINRVMGEVLLALIPGTLAMWWYFGWGVLINIALACGTAVIAEWLCLRARGRDPLPALADLSAVVAGWLLALALSPVLPWWQTVLGSLFAIVVAKHLYGGLGYNPFNPAMVGYVFLLISFPVTMTRWLPPDVMNQQTLTLLDSLRAIFQGLPPASQGWDAVTQATPLDQMRTGLSQNQMLSEIRQNPLWGDYGARGWEWCANWFLLGGLYLVWRKVISWRIPTSLLGALLLIAGLFWLTDPETHPFPAFHLFSGAAILGAFFIATDPVSASTTPRGQLIYGAAIGLLIFVIRTWGDYPDAVAFAVLLLNMAAPTIDHYTQPRVFGARRKSNHGT
ncbi:MAG: electron transport complex subunit RsxD [Pseudomonadota bacterium]